MKRGEKVSMGNGRVFQWTAPQADKGDAPFPLPGPLPPSIISVSGLAAEDVTVDRIQRSHRVPLDWGELITTVFDSSAGTGFEYIRLPLEIEASVETGQDGNPTPASLAKLATDLGFGGGNPKQAFKFGKAWWVRAKTGAQFVDADFANTAAYLAMWKTKVDHLDIQLDTVCTTSFNDLYASEIAKRFEQVKAEVNATSVLIAKADELLNTAVIQNGLDNSYKTSLRRAMDMKVAWQEANARMRELQQKAEAIGYRLDPQNGELIKVTNLSCSFYPAHHRTKLEPVDDLGIGGRSAKLSNERPATFRPAPDWSETKYSYEQALNQAVGLRAGLFERRADEYVAATGHRLSDVLSQLDPMQPDGVFSTITIPVYDIGVNTGERLTRVITAFRPHMGRMPIRLPELFIEQKFRLILRWNGVAVGEVVESTSLAPGEERTLVVERSTVVERETKSTATSSLDVTSEAHSELVSELEAESRRSRDATHSSNWSASASGGVNFGVWNAGGSASGGQTWNETTNEFARKLSKLTQKASSSLTARTRYEVSSTASYKATTTTRESTTINLKNINQGCALTLFLHQLTNRYSKELVLSELSVTVLPAAETLFASEYSLPRQYSLTDVNGFLKAMTVEALPLGYGADKKATLAKYYKTILEAVVDMLKQYKLRSTDASKSADQLLDEVRSETDALKAIALAENNFRQLVASATNLLEGDGQVDGPCAGLLMSTFVGSSTALENYTSQLREAELARRQADTTEVLAHAHQLESVANTIKLVPPDLVAMIRQDGDLRNAIVNFVGNLRTGKWLLLMDEVVLTAFEVADAATLEYKLQFAADQAWLDPAIPTVGFLLHEQTKLYLPFVA